MFNHASMNRSYALVWNDKQQAYVPAPETARSKGKRGGTVLAAALAGLLASSGAFAINAGAIPDGGRVVAGQATITQGGPNMTINQSTARVVIDWQNFNIGRDSVVNFVQPSSSAIALNRVIGQDPTQILGRLNANGQVFVVNPNGVLFGAGAQVSAAGVLASTRDIGNDDFMAGRLDFAGNSRGTVFNAGSINAASNGYVALIGAQVINTGTVRANGGDVRLAAADAVTLKIDGAGLAAFSVDRGTLDALAANHGLIQADGGRVHLTAAAADRLARAVVNNEGVIEARTVENRNGVISLQGDMQVGTVQLSGTLDASAPQGGNGGFVDTSAAHVQLRSSARVTTAARAGKAGNWLIDPVDFTVAASGGDMTGAQLGSALASGNVTIQSTSGVTSGNGDIHINDPVTWNANTLTLEAQRDININANLGGSGSAVLSLHFGLGDVAAGNMAAYRLGSGVTVDLPTGTNFSTLLGSNGVAKTYYVINSLGAVNSTSATDLQGMNGDLTQNYAVGSNIDASASINWNGGNAFVPVGNGSGAYSGHFEGLGHSISQLRVNRQADLLGLFGEISATGRVSNIIMTAPAFTNNDTGTTEHFGAIAGRNYGVIEHVRVLGGSVVGNISVGGVVGTNAGTVRDARATADVGGKSTGGLIGTNLVNGIVEDSSAAASVNGVANVGGLIGANYAALSGLHASGSVVNSEGAYTGGLIGYNEGAISNSYALGAINGTLDTGGLIGKSTGTITGSYATGAVIGSGRVGGLVGTSMATLGASYASGNVTSGSGTGMVGGLVGLNSGTINNNAYSTSLVSGVSQVGGLVGSNTGTITNAHTGNGGTAGPVVTGTGDMTGGLVGNNAGTISNVQATGAVMGAGFTGGLAGRNDSVVTNATASGAVNGTHNTGGLVGIQGPLASIASSIASGNVVATMEYIGGLVGWNDGTIGNSSATGNVQGRDYVGGMVGRGAGNITDAFATGNVNGRNRIGGLVGNQRNGNFTRVSASGNVAGTADLVGGLAGIVTNVNMIDGSVGTGTVSGYVQTGGLYGRMEVGSVSGTTVVNRTVNGTNSVGGLVGFKDQGTITGVAVGGSVTGSGNYVGGFAGQQIGGSIASSSSNAPVSGMIYTGGLIGYNTGTVTLASASGNVTGTTNVGGLIGENLAAVSGLSATGNVVGVYRVGGLIGNSFANVTASNASGTVSSSATNSGVGGLVGDSWENIIDSHATGAVTGFDYTGGLVGFLEAGKSISGSGATGAVQGRHYVGGLLGWSQNGSVTTSTAGGNVTGSTNIGGLIGLTSSLYGHAIVSASSASGNVTGVDAVGGLIGTAGGGSATPTTSQNVSATGNVLASGVNSGGLIGVNSGEILSATASGAVTTTGSVAGGMVGSNAGAVNNAQASGSVAGVSSVGGFVGAADAGLIGLSSATGAVSGSGSDIGGFAGLNAIALYGSGGTAVSASGAVSATGASNVGGFVGRNAGSVNRVTSSNPVTVTGNGSNIGGVVGSLTSTGGITLTRALGTVNAPGSDNVGGLVGLAAANGGIGYSYAANSVTGRDSVGGLAGRSAANISVAYASGAVGGRDRVGGFAGELVTGTDVSHAYATGAVTGNDLVGGFAGAATAGTVQYTYANGAVGGAARSGGYAGAGGATVSDSYFDLNRSGQPFANNDQAAIGALAAGKTTAQMNSAATFTSWDLTDTGAHNTTWRSYDSLAAPLLSYWLTALTVTGAGGSESHVYDGTVHASAVTPLLYTDTLAPGHVLGAASYTTGRNVGTYTALGGLYSDQQGYDMTLLNNGSLTITPKALSVGLTGVGKVYDGSAAAALGAGNFVIGGFIAGEGATIGNTAGQYNSRNVQDASSVSTALSAGDYLAASGTLLSNYTLPTVASGSAAITAKLLNIAASAAGKVYDGGTAAQTTVTASGVIGDDDVAVSGSGAFADKNAGADKQVNIALSKRGADVSNYAFGVSEVTAAATITRRAIEGSASAADKVYDGNISAQVTLASSGIVSGDNITLGATGAFADKNAGTGKTITVTVSASGTDAANYSMPTAVQTAATISPRKLTVALGGSVVKIADGKTDATLAGPNYVIGNVVAGEAVQVNTVAGIYDTAFAGAAKLVIVQLGADSYSAGANTLLSNYVLPAGDVSGKIGLIASPASLEGVYASMPVNTVADHPITLAAVQVQEGLARVSASDETVSDPLAPAAPSALSAITRENLSMRRAFSIGDGGMRLPRGVQGSDKDDAL
ncbi:filamentous hemagglutinin family protein [Actimicrobium sp. GrIS 1.19]|uniref:two-partner secretion domain-containing protein n=1 Tax=Actimicrobium sp. GrIS 1.19 TaxID=3071708 RepID=UPI002DF76178|nr:filamentous hemagglutinin family protein [Actimicrobium sp. GrIS 1.19]